ncbi:MAG TPA: VCBS repeat-containing protein [Chitinophagaceae bacterium]|nr:VCBS repeat-containing protein [Chitinophagaceae bacterium]
MRIQESKYDNKWIVKISPFICFLFLWVIFLLSGCKNSDTEPHDAPLFKVLDNKVTGIDFRNDLTYNKEFNLFKYIYFYNGSGVGAGDFNNDGKIDLFFGSNQGRNRLFINKGQMKFADATMEANIPDDGGWTTGVSVVDINNDGLLDIYVCRVGNYEILRGKNLLLINKGVKNGIPMFADEAAAHGLDFSGFSTQATFFDYDLDGDLDMYLLNHSVHQNGTFKPRSEFLNTSHPLSGDKFYRNDNGKYTEVTKETGIQSSAIGYGLGIVISDVNLDGYPDMYTGNDFHENDYLYINQKDGTFKDECTSRMMHTSQYSMGVDAADINNDGWPEIVSMDMLPFDPYILKRSLGEDAYDIFNFKIRSGYGYQFTRNNLQYNRRNGLFSEIGLYSGIAATDWSWAPLWVDFNNDGLKDLFVSNGIPKRMNDIDYINFISNSEVQQRIITNTMEQKNMALIDKFPQIKLPNKFYLNNHNLSFVDEEKNIEGSKDTYSNGAAYADLDGDGDLDIVVNNIDDAAIIYENKSGNSKQSESFTLKLKGPKNNINAIGSRVVLFTANEIRTYEKFPVRGFMSSMEMPILIGRKNSKIDSALLIWPDNSYQQIQLDNSKQEADYHYSEKLPQFDFNSIRKFNQNTTAPVTDITNETGLQYLHKENHFVEFDREALLPHMFSTEGPAIAVADINNDGMEDIFLGSARNRPGVIYLQQLSGKFLRSGQPALEADSSYETTDAVWADVNNDGYPDLIAASGGNEFYGPEIHNTPRVYLNNKNIVLERKKDAFDSLYLTASSIAANDFTGDGYIDLFIGAKTVPWNYGAMPGSYLLQNDGTGRFKDVTDKFAEALNETGFITSAEWIDMNGDEIKDLVCSCEWGSPVIFIYEHGKFIKQEMTDKKGWWNFLLPFDADNDGDTDFIAGNLGWNSRLKASKKQPVQLYYNDFDDNDKEEQVLTYYLAGKEIPFANKSDLEKQMPALKKKYLYAEDFAKASLTEMFGADKLKNAAHFSSDYFSNAIFINQGNLKFDVVDLPFEAQLTEMKCAVVVDANHDNLRDILIMGNYYDNNIEMGRYDADYGTLLINKGNGKFITSQLNGLSVKGQVRCIKNIRIGKLGALLLGRNNDSLKVITFGK